MARRLCSCMASGRHRARSSRSFRRCEAFAASGPIFRAPGGRRAPTLPFTIDVLVRDRSRHCEGDRRRAGAYRGAFDGNAGGSASRRRRVRVGGEPHPVRPDRRAWRGSARTLAGSGGACAAERHDRHSRSCRGGRSRYRRPRPTIRPPRRSSGRAILRQDPEGFAQSCEALASAKGADLRLLNCPTLVVTGEEDPIAPPGAAQGLAERIKGAKLKTLPRCGHWTPIEQPKECARLASEHIRAHA